MSYLLLSTVGFGLTTLGAPAAADQKDTVLRCGVIQVEDAGGDATDLPEDQRTEFAILVPGYIDDQGAGSSVSISDPSNTVTSHASVKLLNARRFRGVLGYSFEAVDRTNGLLVVLPDSDLNKRESVGATFRFGNKYGGCVIAYDAESRAYFKYFSSQGLKK